MLSSIDSSRALPLHQTLPYLSRLIVSGHILHSPTIHHFLLHLLPTSHLPLSYPLSLHHFPYLFPSTDITTTTLFNLLFRRLSSNPNPNPNPKLPLLLFSSLLLLLPSPSPSSFPPLLNSLPLSSPTSIAPQFHSQLLLRGLLPRFPFVLNSLLSLYSRLRSLPDAATLLRSLTNFTDIVSSNILINAYVKSGSIRDARHLFDEMPVRDPVSWTAMINGYAIRGEMDLAKGLFDRMPVMDRTVVTWNTVVAGFARCGIVGLARKYFDEMPMRNLVSWNVMVNGYAGNGEMGLARELFELMPERDVVSWSCLVKGYAGKGWYLDALKVFERMIKEGRVRPNEVTVVSVLSACAHLSALDHGKWVHAYIDKNRMVLDNEYNLGAALIDMYFKCASMESAVGIFRSLKWRNVSSWNAFITGLGINGLASDALLAFEEMQRSGTEPDGITFVAVLSACTHGGLVEEGRKYFKSMYEVYGVRREMKHYGCMVDLLGRAGLLEEAEGIVKMMPMKADVMVLGALLGACQIHGNVEVAERVKNDFLKLNSRQAGCHVLLSNIYATADRWADASNMRENLEKKGIKKIAGSSSVV